MIDDRGDRSAEAGREGDAQFRTAMQASPIGFCLVGPDGSFLAVNPALCELLGRDEATLTASTWQELTHPEDVGADQRLVDEILAGRRDDYRIVKRYLRPDGSVVWGDLSVGCVRDRAGTVKQFISQIVDVTLERTSGQALAKSQEEYRLLAENASDLVFRSKCRDGVDVAVAVVASGPRMVAVRSGGNAGARPGTSRRCPSDGHRGSHDAGGSTCHLPGTVPSP